MGRPTRRSGGRSNGVSGVTPELKEAETSVGFQLAATYVLLGGLTLIPIVWAWEMLLYYARNAGLAPPPKGPLPRAAVLLSVRGADPSLGPCLEGLLDLDYPGYAVRITVDSE